MGAGPIPSGAPEPGPSRYVTFSKWPDAGPDAFWLLGSSLGLVPACFWGVSCILRVFSRWLHALASAPLGLGVNKGAKHIDHIKSRLRGSKQMDFIFTCIGLVIFAACAQALTYSTRALEQGARALHVLSERTLVRTKHIEQRLMGIQQAIDRLSGSGAQGLAARA